MFYKTENSEEDLVGFFFANQDKIRNFISEENEQKMMNKIRSNCDIMEAKNKGYVQEEIRKQKEVIQASVNEIFSPALHEKESVTASFKFRNYEEEKPKPLSRYLVAEGYSNKPETPKGFKEKRSSSNANLSSSGLGHSIYNGRRPNYEDPTFGNPFFPNKTSYESINANFTGLSTTKSNTRHRPLERTDLWSHTPLRNTRQANERLLQTTELINMDKFKDRMFKKIDNKRPNIERCCPHEAYNDPMATLQRKIAQFDIKENSKYREAEQREHNRNDWQRSIDANSDPRMSQDPTTIGLVANTKVANVESLRNFRQRMRERYTKDTATIGRHPKQFY